MSSEEENNQSNEVIVRIKKDKEEPSTNEQVNMDALEQENAELKERLDLIAQKEFEKARNKVKCDDPTIDTPEKLLAWSKGQKHGESAAGGTAPLQNQTYGTGDSFTKKQFDSPKAMVDELKLRMNSDNPEVKAEARSIYEHLLQKAIRQGGTGTSEGIGLKELVRKPKKERD